MRALILGDGWRDDRAGGLNRYLAELLAERQELGLEDRAVVVGPGRSAPTEVATPGTTTEPLLLRLWRFQRAARRAADHTTVVDAHFALHAMWPVVFGALRALPLVVHFHGPWADESGVAGATRLQILAKRVIERSVYRKARQAVVLSGAFKKVLVERYGVAPWIVSVIAPGVDLERFSIGDRVAARARLDLDTDAPVVVCVRRLVPRMGIDILLNAWVDIVAGQPNARLLIVGAGTERGALEALAARRGIGETVRFMGKVDDETLVACYQAADVSVVPSTALEGFGLIVLESYACGTPTIASDVGGLPEVVSPLDPTAIVPAGDAPVLAARLGTALAKSDGQVSRDDCRRYAESFSWEQVALRHQEIYARALQPRHDKLRVVYLDHCAQFSGGELALVRLLPALTDVDAHVVLAEEGPLVARLLRAGISTEVLPMASGARDLRKGEVRPGGLSLRSASGSAAYVARLAMRLRRLRPDLVHTNSLKAAVYGGMAARLAGVPVVWHIRDRIADDYLPGPAVRLIRQLARWLPMAVVANSQATLESLGPLTQPTAVLPSPVSADLWERRATERSPREFAKVGIVGRLAPWKGQHLFLDAFAQAFPSGSEEAVVIGAALFGEETYESGLRQQARELELDDRVDFRGFRDDIGAELEQLDMVVHASTIAEPFGNVVVEAMAMGLPVAAADAGGPAEVIDHEVNGVLYRMGDVDALSRAMRRIAGDREFGRRLGLAARDRAQDFGADAVASQLMDIYGRLPDRVRDEGSPSRDRQLGSGTGDGGILQVTKC